MAVAEAERDSSRASVPEGIRPFVDSGVLGTFEAHLVSTFQRLEPRSGHHDLLALGLVSRATRAGHVCVDVARLSDVELEATPDDAVGDLDWPTPDSWSTAVTGSPLVDAAETVGDGLLRPLVLDRGRLYLHRYWSYEIFVTRQLTDRSAIAGAAPGGVRLPGDEVATVIDTLFAPVGADADDGQRSAAERALRNGVSVIAGGPGRARRTPWRGSSPPPS